MGDTNRAKRDGGDGVPYEYTRGGEDGKIPKFFLPPVRFGGAAAFI